LRLRLKVRLRGESPRVSSVVPVWKGANWLEREAFDMYGITFDGHPDLRRILLTPEWKGFPLRKDYPLRG
ncbi:MAG TPA: NADH-quinone oxidoreductase subunit C, partial [Syntrophales bacterium]